MQWRIHKGSRRLVLELPWVGLVVKLPRVIPWRVKEFIKYDVVGMWREMHASPCLENRKLYWEGVRLGFWRCMYQTIGGGVDNWRERSYYKHCNMLERLFLQPTHLSLLGIINVQRYGKPVDEEDSDAMYHAFFPVAGQDLITDGHHWTHASNFHLAPDGPKILDYGGEATQAIIDKHGLELYKKFDLEFGRAQTAHYRKIRTSS